MDDTLKHRIIGIIVLIASAAIFIPLFFKTANHSTATKQLDVVMPQPQAQPELSLDDSMPKVAEPMSAIDAVADNTQAKPAVAPTVASNKPDVARPAVDDGLDLSDDPANDEPPTVADAVPAVPASKVAAAKPELLKEPAPAPAVAAMDDEPIISAPVAPRVVKVKPVHAKVAKPVVSKIASKKPASQPLLAKPQMLAAVVNKPQGLGKPHAYQPAATQSSAATAAPVGSWVVQCASFSAHDHAVALQTALKQSGYNAYVKEGHTNTGPISRVFVGTATNRQTAEALQHSLQANHTQAIVVNAAVLRG